MRFATLILLLTGISLAQPAVNPLVGTWHIITEPKYPQGLLIFSPDGFYAQVTIAPGRSKLKNDFDHRTREELMKQFGGLRASYGSWKTDATKLLRTCTASEDPAREGTETTADFRIEGDTLILNPNGQHPSRFRRMK